MTSEKAQATEKRVRNSDAQNRGGCTRSSDEVAVMAVERRGTVIQYDTIKQLKIRRILW